jgi:large subunit ribosomal protein L10
VLKTFSKEVQFIAMRGGVLTGAVVNAQQLEALASLPPREVLLAQVVGTIAAPLRNTVGVLSALPRNLVNVLDQIRKQKEETPAA